MTTFDDILPVASEVFSEYPDALNDLDWVVINRDLNGRVRLIAPDSVSNVGTQKAALEAIYSAISERIAPHAYPLSSGILYEATKERACHGVAAFRLSPHEKVWVVDRLVTETRWETIADQSPGVPRIVFFSIKGGVGRSTALASSAWYLANEGKKVMVLDLDLESPGLSSALMAPERQPKYGITDWLVEDLVDNGDGLLDALYATSDLPTPGTIYLVPAHGANPGEYVAKLGRCWMARSQPGSVPEPWAARLSRLVEKLEKKLQPDVILIDSRAGIDEVAAACVTDLGAHTILMFAIQGQQTWTGYKALISHWEQRDVITSIRTRLQLVAAMVPDDDRRIEYLMQLRTDAYNLFEHTYDAVGPGAISDWSFDQDDDTAPHYPLPVRWNRGWYGLLSLQQRIAQVDLGEVTSVYGPLLNFIDRVLIPETGE